MREHASVTAILRALGRPSASGGGAAYVRNAIARLALDTSHCVGCQLGPEWGGKPLVLRLDHINGVNRDHRLENLRFLCPNCDSQTATFCGRSIAKATHKTCRCGTTIAKSSVQCRSCGHRKPRAKRAAWPPMEELLDLIAKTSKSEVVRQLGVAESSVRNHLKRSAPGGTRTHVDGDLKSPA